MHGQAFSTGERLLLWVSAAIGFFGVNGVFVYSILHPSIVRDAMANPLAVAFVVEAMVLVALLAFLLAKWELSDLPWWWFVTLSLVGSIMFALPVVLLWRSRGSPEEARS